MSSRKKDGRLLVDIFGRAGCASGADSCLLLTNFGHSEGRVDARSVLLVFFLEQRLFCRSVLLLRLLRLLNGLLQLLLFVHTLQLSVGEANGLTPK